MEHYSKTHSNTGQKSTLIWPCYDNDFLAEASNVKEKYIKHIKYITITHYCEMFEPRSHLTT